jgi:predicted Zn-dependent peptidase
MMPPVPAPLLAPPTLATLPNGVRVLVQPMPHLATAQVSVYLGIGSVHEPRQLSGIGHVVEHMVFKGSRHRDARRINLDAERLGADLNAHTDKDHTAFHLRGLATDAPEFVGQLADLVRHPTFPEDEFARERQVLLLEYTEDEEDPMSAAFRLFDRACWGLQPAGQPVIGSRRNIERFDRAALLAHVRQGFCGRRAVVAVAGGVDVDAVLRAAEAAFGDLPAGDAATWPAPAFHGGVRARRLAGSSQVHAVLGFPIPGRETGDLLAPVAATLLGEGMSSPLMDRIREQRGLVYYAACSADAMIGWGEFVIEASLAPERLDEYLQAVVALLREVADGLPADDLERARRQWAVRLLRSLEKPGRWLEDAALDLLALGRVRSPAERREAVAALTPQALRDGFARWLAGGTALGLAGAVPRAGGAAAQHTLRALAGPI